MCYKQSSNNVNSTTFDTMDIKPKRSLWQYWKDNAMIFVAFIFFIGLGLESYREGSVAMTLFMAFGLVLAVVASIIDLKKNG